MSASVASNPDIRRINRAQFETAKAWWGASFLIKLALVIIGTILIFLIPPLDPWIPPFITFILTIAAELVLFRSDQLKGKAEFLLRKLDERDSFGTPITAREISDLVIGMAPKERFQVQGQEEQYFASREPLGEKRALQNIDETAWWTKHLASAAGWYYLIGMSILVLISVIVLLVSLFTIQDQSARTNLGRVLTSALMVVFSLGLFRATAGYFSSSRKAEQAEERAEEMLRSGALDRVEVMKLSHEYQISRAGAPLIPTWVYNRKKDELNQQWNHRQSTSQGSQP